MKPAAYLVSAGKWLMKKGHLQIVIADDEEIYFNERMLRTARDAGYHGISRVPFVTSKILGEWLRRPPHIIILDFKNVVDSDVATDGIELSRLLLRETSAMICMTSAHKFHLSKSLPDIDYIIESRNPTSADFVEELSVIVERYLAKKSRFYRHIALRVGTSLVRGAMQNSG